MPLKTLIKNEVGFYQILDKDGNVDKKLMPDLHKNTIKLMFEYMLFARVFDEKAIKLQRQGKIGTYASVRGQEASQVGSALALADSDWIFPSFREVTAEIVRDTPLPLLLQWAWDERAMHKSKNLNNFTMSVPVGTHPLHAVGAAWAFKMQKKKIATLAYFGDGATSEGDFHEAMNFAGVFKLPVIFLCQNNQYAISLPRNKQCAAYSLAQKAHGYGFEGLLVDGNDVFAVFMATQYAREKAKKCKGPTFIECYTYRMADHTTSDDAKRYRSEKEVREWAKQDPIDRLRKYMQKNKMWTKKYENDLMKKFLKTIDKAGDKVGKTWPPMPNEEIFSHMYAELPLHLMEQMEELKEYERGGQ